MGRGTVVGLELRSCTWEWMKGWRQEGGRGGGTAGGNWNDEAGAEG